MKCFKENWFLLGIITILLGSILFCLMPKMDITNNYIGVILGFVGVLATFIVVGNYAQVQQIRSEMLDKIRLLDEKTDNLSKYAHEIHSYISRDYGLSTHAAIYILDSLAKNEHEEKNVEQELKTVVEITKNQDIKFGKEKSSELMSLLDSIEGKYKDNENVKGLINHIKEYRLNETLENHLYDEE